MRLTIDFILGLDPCPHYTRERLEEIFAGREFIELCDVPAVPHRLLIEPRRDMLWLLLRCMDKRGQCLAAIYASVAALRGIADHDDRDEIRKELYSRSEMAIRLAWEALHGRTAVDFAFRAAARSALAVSDQARWAGIDGTSAEIAGLAAQAVAAHIVYADSGIDARAALRVAANAVCLHDFHRIVMFSARMIERAEKKSE